jgi:hypothetical protein
MVNAPVCLETLGFKKLKNKSSVQQSFLWGFAIYEGIIYFKIVKVNFALEQATKAHTGSS